MEEVNSVPARSYRQFCGLARSLDVVGDRWNLLIVRELLVGPLRYGELAASLGGIATNLLADRLRGLEAAGVVERRLGEAGVVYALTPWGEQLRETVEALVRWSRPLMLAGQGGDAFQPRWLAVALPALLSGRTAQPAVEVGIAVPGLSLTLRLDETGPTVAVDPERPAGTILAADPEVVLGLAAGAITLDQALAVADVHGDRRLLATVFAPDR